MQHLLYIFVKILLHTSGL